MTSDPAGLPSEDSAIRMVFRDLEKEKAISLSGTWHWADSFRSQSMAILGEALESLRSFNPLVASYAAKGVAVADAVALFYPRGAVAILHDSENGNTAFKVAIPRPKR